MPHRVTAALRKLLTNTLLAMMLVSTSMCMGKLPSSVCVFVVDVIKFESVPARNASSFAIGATSFINHHPIKPGRLDAYHVPTPLFSCSKDAASPASSKVSMQKPPQQAETVEGKKTSLR